MTTGEAYGVDKGVDIGVRENRWSGDWVGRGGRERVIDRWVPPYGGRQRG